MGLSDDVKENTEMIRKMLESNQVKKKKFRYPFGKKVGKGQKKRNYVTVLVINDNLSCNFHKYQIQDMTFIHNMIPRLGTARHVLHDKKGNPLIILPNWSVEPVSPNQEFKKIENLETDAKDVEPFDAKENYEQSIENGSNINAYRVLMARMESEKVEGKKKMGKILPWIIGIGLVGLILFAVLSGGGN